MTMINTNVGALLARTYATMAAERMQKSMERLSSGKRINSSADDAAGLAVANKMLSQLEGVKMAIRNSQDGISLVQTADGAYSEISKVIRRMRELAVQMQNGIYTTQDRSNAQMEIRALLAEIDKITENTQYNNVNLLDGSYDQDVRAGNANSETIRIMIGSAASEDAAKITGFKKNVATLTSQEDDGTSTLLAATAGVSKATSKVEINTSVFSSDFKDTFNADSLGTFTLTAENFFDIDEKTGKLTSTSTVTASSYALTVTYTPRDTTVNAAHAETITVVVTAATEVALSAISVETSAEATHAIESLDKALEEMSSAQAKLGAIQNRLGHNIDNLSKGSMLTEQSVGRVIDADYATETAELSKQQILSQAATSMLAQANVSKQGVIALLR